MKTLRPFRQTITLRKGKTQVQFLPSGDIFSMMHGGLQINALQGSPSEGSANNIYLRLYDKDGARIAQAAPLLGLSAGGEVSAGENSLVTEGRVGEIAYRVRFVLATEFVWFWEIRLIGRGPRVDVLYGQDLGMAQRSMVRTNELFSSQYLGHTVLEGPQGYVVCSRQNLPQAGGSFPYLQQGMLTGRAVSYGTDGTQFFGLSYRESGEPQALFSGLPSENYQYEFAYTGLGSEDTVLAGESRFVFYGLLRPDHPEAVEGIGFEEELLAASKALDAQDALRPLAPLQKSQAFGQSLASAAWSQQEVARRFPKRRIQEREDGALLSFFTAGHSHVVLREKELRCERPHGHILLSGVNETAVDERVLAVTNLMGGVFAAQMVVGNTSLHKFLSVPRAPLDVLRHQGLRIYVRLEGKYRLLTLPAAYVMTVSSSRWYYVLPNQDTLMISSYCACEETDWVLTLESETGQAYDFLLVGRLVLGEHEGEDPLRVEEMPGLLRFSPSQERADASPYPGWHFDLGLPEGEVAIGDDGVFFADGAGRDETLLSLALPMRSSFRLMAHGSLTGEGSDLKDYRMESEARKFARLYRRMSGGFHLAGGTALAKGIDRINELIPWYLHNALTHFASPHGLEQPGGAAWGTRDVCQGPFELLLTGSHFGLARQVLLRVFTHQSRESGEWPQWFMFDRYPIHAGECHGDVMLWPLKCVGDYITASGDLTVLMERIPYGDSGAKETLLSHIRKTLAHWEARLLPGTSLLSYAGGDWDDTLRPAQEEMGQRLVSAWTQALGYQVAVLLSRSLAEAAPELSERFSSLALGMGEDFTRYLIAEGQIAGFVRREADGRFTPLLHALDQETGIHCRLLPLTRSILAELADREQARRNLERIDACLFCADGVRLMDRPAHYQGGVSHLFQRAEQAANVGREIGLQYVHAHIRYVEAMAKLGEGKRAWEGLLMITPPGLKESVANACLRQSNLYYSSSEGQFPDRYAFERDFARLRDGSIGAKGGWRLYSSGPGIFIRTLVSYVLGIRVEGESLCVDPVLPKELDGLSFSFEVAGQVLHFVYHVSPGQGGGTRVCQNGLALPGRWLENPYRAAGLALDLHQLQGLACQTLDVYAEG